MNKTFITSVVITVIIAGGIAFYGGIKYDQSQQPATGQRPQQFSGGRRNNGQGGNINNFVAGEILSKDSQSVTIKSNDGSSKIVFFSSTTKIMQSTEGTPANLMVGKQAIINGSANQDGSFNAQIIQIRPLPAQSHQPSQ